MKTLSCFARMRALSLALAVSGAPIAAPAAHASQMEDNCRPLNVPVVEHAPLADGIMVRQGDASVWMRANKDVIFGIYPCPAIPKKVFANTLREICAAPAGDSKLRVIYSDGLDRKQVAGSPLCLQVRKLIR